MTKGTIRGSRISKTLFALGCTISLVVSGFAQGAAFANDDQGSAEQQIAYVVAEAAPSELSFVNTEAVARQDGFGSNGSVDVDISSESTKPVVLTSDEGDELKVHFDPSVEAEGGLAADGSVVYLDSNQVAQTVQPTEDGVRINTVVTSSQAPEEYRHEVELPNGVRMVTGVELEELTPEEFRAESSNGIFFLDEANQLVGGISAPWEVDAEGNNVPTHYTIDGNTVIQHVAHKDANFSYPVVADPWLGFSLISSAKWVKLSQGWTLSVKPTGWARANAPGYLVGVAGWNELYSKYKNKGLNKNLGRMKDQYICHQQFAFLKSAWNLDEWCPDVSYARTVAAKCNP